VHVQVRTTPSGTRQCVTLTLKAETVEDVEAVYHRLFHLPDLQLLL
jgi:putative lipoic acid-binding regulatory protein